MAELSVHKPTIWSIEDEKPIAVLNGEGYRSNATNKHGNFGSYDDQVYVACGSDSFETFVWQIPSVKSLRDRCETREFSSWLSSEDTISYTTGPEAARHSPVSLNAACTLGKGQSIVNEAVFHPRLPLLATSGVEKVIRIHSPLPGAASPAAQTRSSADIRRLVPSLFKATELRQDSWADELDDRAEDAETIEMFRQLATEERELRFSSIVESDSDDDELRPFFYDIGSGDEGDYGSIHFDDGASDRSYEL